MPALALTDLANPFGLVKVLPGHARRGRQMLPVATSIANGADPDRPYRLLLLCRNRQGYQQLCELLYRAYLVEGRTRRAEITRQWFAEVGCDGLIALRRGLGDVGEAPAQRQRPAGERRRAWAELFPRRLLPGSAALHAARGAGSHRPADAAWWP